MVRMFIIFFPYGTSNPSIFGWSTMKPSSHASLLKTWSATMISCRASWAKPPRPNPWEIHQKISEKHMETSNTTQNPPINPPSLMTFDESHWVWHHGRFFGDWPEVRGYLALAASLLKVRRSCASAVATSSKITKTWMPRPPNFSPMQRSPKRQTTGRAEIEKCMCCIINYINWT